jgi:CheY-like chemotaxis protein/two-component sensor histidine kinase
MAGWVHILRGGESIDPATLERGLAAIDRSVKAQMRLVDDLLDYSRLVVGKLYLVRRLTDLALVAQAAAESVRAAAEAKEICLELASKSETAIVLGDPDRLQQVVWNLLSNAVKFTPRGGRINVSIARVGTLLHLVVCDTGQGIRPDFLPYVFERFRQAEPSPRRQTGLGLGLAIVKQLVEQHGGTVQAASPGEGRGATFTIGLPVPALLLEPKGVDGTTTTIEDPMTSDQGRGERNRPVLQGVRVLIVEDDADGREMLVTMLEQHGAEVRQATSAKEAMRALEQETSDVLVCDIGLPDEDGHQLIRRVRKLRSARERAIPALALTAYAAPDDRRKALAAGFDVHLAKPAAPAELVAKVAALAIGGGRND